MANEIINVDFKEKELITVEIVSVDLAQQNKADRVPSAVEDNFVSFDDTGNIKDSGHKDADYEDAGTAASTLATHNSTYVHNDIALNTTARHSHSNKTELDKVTDGDHDVRTDNPHSVTKTQVGLGNVPNIDTTLASNVMTDASGVSVQDALDTIEAGDVDSVNGQTGDVVLNAEDINTDETGETVQSHIDNTSNPHSVTKTQVGLGNVDDKSEATIITDVKADADVASAISLKHTQGTDQALDTGGANEISAANAKAAYTHSGVTTGNPHQVTKTDVGLSDVTNDAQVTRDEMGVALGVATLDGGGKVPVTMLPNSIMDYKGTWNATTNIPTLADGESALVTGDVYRVSVGGTQNLGSGAITFVVGDYCIYNGTTWEKADTTDAVATVNGYTGNVELVADDIGTDNSGITIQDELDSKYANDAINQYSLISSKNPLVDNDLTIFEDSQSAPVGIKRSVYFSTIKSTLKTYFDGIYFPNTTLADEIYTVNSGQSIQDALDLCLTAESDTLNSVLGRNNTSATYSIVLTAGTLSAGADTDTTHILGRAKIGGMSTYDALFVSHYDQFALGTYAITQDASGATSINSATGQEMNFRINNASMGKFTSTLWTNSIPTTINCNSTTALNVGNAGSNTLVVDTTNGRVGVNATALNTPLTVVGGAYTDALLLTQNETNNTNKYSGLVFGRYATATPYYSGIWGDSRSDRQEIYFGGGNGTLYGATALRFYTAPNITTATGTQRMMIDSAGLVGIGITPATALDVDSNSNTQCLRLRGADAANEIGDIYVDDQGQFIISAVNGSDNYNLIELRPKNASFGVLVRETDGTGTSAYLNINVIDDSTDYVNILCNSANDRLGLTIDANQDVAVNNLTIRDSKNISLDPAPASDHNCTGVISTGTAGENLVFGDICYLKSDGKYWKAKGDSATTMPCVVMAVATINAEASGNILHQGYVRDDSWAFTVGATVWVSAATAGLVTTTQPSTSGDQIQALGYATHADYMFFNPNLVVVEKA